MHWRSSRAGFTLIELMVVIAVIGILVAILFPVFSTAREKARQTKCQAHLMQLVTALQEFRTNEGHYPPVPQYNETAGRYEGGFSALYPDYVTDRKLFICPDDREALQNLGDCRDRVYCSYNGLIDWSTGHFRTFTSGGAAILYNYHGYTYSCELLTDGDENCTGALAGYSSGYDTDQTACILPGYGTWPLLWMDGDTNNIPDFLDAAGLRWQHFPGLANRGAPDYTIVTHCPHHRKYYDDPLEEMDVVVTLGGQTSLVNVTNMGNPDPNVGGVAGVAAWVHQNF